MTADNLFESPNLLFESAMESAIEFDRLQKTFIDNCTYTTSIRKDVNTGEDVARLKLNARLPGQLRVLAYRIICDLRHSLDQQVGDCALLLGRPDAKRIYFPVGKSIDDFKAEVKSRLRGVHPELVKHIEELNTNETHEPFLYAFLALSGPIKHQRIISIGVEASETQMMSAGLEIKGPVTFGINKWNAAKNEIEFARIGTGGRLKGYFNVPITITLGEGGAPFCATAVEDFNKAIGSIREIMTALRTKAESIKAATP